MKKKQPCKNKDRDFANWTALQDFLHGAPYSEMLPEDFGPSKMYTSARSPAFNAHIPSVLFGSENCFFNSGMNYLP